MSPDNIGAVMDEALKEALREALKEEVEAARMEALTRSEQLCRKYASTKLWDCSSNNFFPCCDLQSVV